MKLLLDQNLSRRLVDQISTEYPKSTHVSTFDPEERTDREVWEFARTEGFVIVSKDSDFEQLAVLHGAPPKVIWLRIGNSPTATVLRLLRERSAEIHAFVANPDDAVLLLHEQFKSTP